MEYIFYKVMDEQHYGIKVKIWYLFNLINPPKIL